MDGGWKPLRRQGTHLGVRGSQDSLQLRLSTGPSYPGFAQAQVYVGLLCLGANSACMPGQQLPRKRLPTALIREVLAQNGLRVPARDTAKVFLVRIRAVDLARDSAFALSAEAECVGLQNLVFFLFARGCGVCQSQTAV